MRFKLLKNSLIKWSGWLGESTGWQKRGVPMPLKQAFLEEGLVENRRRLGQGGTLEQSLCSLHKSELHTACFFLFGRVMVTKTGTKHSCSIYKARDIKAL